MNALTKVLLFCSVPGVLLAILAVPSLKSSSTQGSGDAWAPLRSGGVDYLVPQGFTATDPFTTSTEHYPKRWALGWPSKQTHIAHLAADSRVFQIFLLLGSRIELEPLLAEARSCYANSVLVELGEPQTWKTQDGVTVNWQKLRYPPGLIAGDDDTFLLAHAVVGDRLLIVNAGGLTEGFDTTVVGDVVRALSLGE